MKVWLTTNDILPIPNFAGYILIFIWVKEYETILLVLFGFLIIANFVMDILTLSLEKHEAARGLIIASEILIIFNEMFFVNAIVSFIAVAKISNAEKQFDNDLSKEE